MWLRQNLPIAGAMSLAAPTVWIAAAAVVCLVIVIAVLVKRSHQSAAAPEPEPEAAEEELDEETFAIVVAAVCEELHTDPKNIRITSIREMSETASNA